MMRAAALTGGDDGPLNHYKSRPMRRFRARMTGMAPVGASTSARPFPRPQVTAR